jgi:hypothetical protein
MGDALRHFPGASSSLRYIPTSSGSNITQSSSALFMLPQELRSYIRPGSMYMKGTVTITGAVINPGFAWAFGGQISTAAGGDAANATNINGGNGSANSLFNRWTVSFGGLSMSYSNTNQFSSCVVPHASSKDYLESDCRQSELRGFLKQGAAGDAATNKTATFCVPVPLPCFNAEQAFPMLLLNGGIQIEVQTETLNAAIYAFNAAHATGYGLSNLTLCYELTTVTEDFKRALIAAKASSGGYLLHQNDVTSIGPQSVAAGASTRLSLGVSLSSLRGGVFSMQPIANVTSVANAKFWTTNSMSTYTVSVNGQIVTLSNINDDTVMYMELQRALSRIGDITCTSSLAAVVNTTTTNLRNNYTTAQFAAGFSTASYDGWEATSCGIACDNIALDLTLVAASNANLFQAVINSADSSLYLWLFHDSVLVFGPDGMVTLRK